MPETSGLTPAERSSRARLGGLAVSAKHDTKELTKPARAAFEQRFIDEVDPDRVLSESERVRRAEAARRLYFQRLAWKSARARRSRSRAEP